ncbi:MAG: GNAT family N-acetyltransferase [Pikeienuella sp.]
MTPEFSLQRADLADLSAILKLVEELHKAEHIGLEPDVRREAVGNLIDSPALGGVWVMRAETAAGHRVIGYVAIAYGFSIAFGGRDGFLDEICIAADYRGRGIGSAAIARLKAVLKADGIKALHLEVNRDNERAQALYGSLGFEMRRQYHLMTVEFED